MKKYRLYKGFAKIGEFETILEAKAAAKERGMYNLIGNDYKDSFYVW